MVPNQSRHGGNIEHVVQQGLIAAMRSALIPPVSICLCPQQRLQRLKSSVILLHGYLVHGEIPEFRAIAADMLKLFLNVGALLDEPVPHSRDTLDAPRRGIGRRRTDPPPSFPFMLPEDPAHPVESCDDKNDSFGSLSKDMGLLCLTFSTCQQNSP